MGFVLFHIYLVDEDVHHSCRIPPPLDALERSLAVFGDSVASPFFNCRVSARLPLREKLLGSLHLDGVDSDLPYLYFCSTPCPVPK